MAPELPATILGAYALSNTSVVAQFESYGNENWLIEDRRGHRFVLRRHCLNADIGRIEFQLALQRHLTDHGFPASAVVETESQERIAINDDDGVPWVLIIYVPGREYDFDRPQQVTSAARSLAQFHLITESFQWDAPGPEHKVPIRYCWANAKQDLLELAELLEGDAVEEDLSYLSGWWEHVLSEWSLDRLDALPSGWLHGDFHGRNLAFDGDHVAGLFDFDDVDTGPYVYDLAAGLLKFGREARGSVTIRPEFARRFIEGYETLRPISREERAALRVMVAMGYPPNPRNYRYWRDQRGEAIERRFHRDIANIRTLRAEMERIGPLIT